MRNRIGASAYLMLVLAGLGCFSVFVSAAAQARAERVGEGTAEDYVVGGEPGEDPHLKVNPEFIPMKESDGGVGAANTATGSSDALERDVVGSGGKGMLYGGSRVNQVWRMILQMLLWHMHR